MIAFSHLDPAHLTPEHLQLLSDARLRAIADRGALDGSGPAGTDDAWRRLARYELKRRHAPHLRHQPEAEAR